jgi:hypothetical protein
MRTRQQDDSAPALASLTCGSAQAPPQWNGLALRRRARIVRRPCPVGPGPLMPSRRRLRKQGQVSNLENSLAVIIYTWGWAGGAPHTPLPNQLACVRARSTTLSHRTRGTASYPHRVPRLAGSERCAPRSRSHDSARSRCGSVGIAYPLLSAPCCEPLAVRRQRFLALRLAPTVSDRALLVGTRCVRTRAHLAPSG